MNIYTPDRWVIIEVKGVNITPFYRILASWYGGFAGNDYWKLSSGISGIDPEDATLYPQCSGSQYRCVPQNHGLSTLTADKLATWNKIEGATFTVMPEGFQVPKEYFCEVNV